MKHTLVALLGLFILSSSPARADESEAKAKATESAQAWLALIDAGKYSDSWDHASSIAKAAASREDWAKAIKTGRTPLGGLKARKLKSATYARTLPGAPDGEYVVIQYATQFEHKAEAIETVTPAREKDGLWKVSGYFIR